MTMEDALYDILVLAVTAPTDAQADRAVQLAESIAVCLDAETVERIKTQVENDTL